MERFPFPSVQLLAAARFAWLTSVGAVKMAVPGCWRVVFIAARVELSCGEVSLVGLVGSLIG